MDKTKSKKDSKTKEHTITRKNAGMQLSFFFLHPATLLCGYQMYLHPHIYPYGGWSDALLAHCSPKARETECTIDQQKVNLTVFFMLLQGHIRQLHDALFDTLFVAS